MTEQHSPPVTDAWRRTDDAEAIDDPLTDCLIQLCRLYNLPATRTALRAGLPLVGNRLTVELFPRAAERAGLAARLVKRPLGRMTGLELPAVLLLVDGRACVLAAIDRERGEATVLLPETGLGESRLAHTMDARRGTPVNNGVASVTVLARTCMQADAWATALLVAGPGEGLAMAQRMGLDALFLLRRAEGLVEMGLGRFGGAAR